MRCPIYKLLFRNKQHFATEFPHYGLSEVGNDNVRDTNFFQ